MACNTSLQAILKDCSNNIGGVAKIYLAPSEFISATTVTTGTVVSVDFVDDLPQFVEFQFNKNSANYVEEAAISLENGSTFYTTTLTITIPRREVAKRNKIALVASGQRNLSIIILDNNGLYWWMGYANYANLTGLGEGSGTVKGDGSKYTLTFLAEEPELMFEVNALIIPDLLQ